MRGLFFSLAVWLFVCAIVSTAFAKTITIPADAATLQDAVNLAASGDEIVLGTEIVQILNYSKNPDHSGYADTLVISDKDLMIRSGGDQPAQLVSAMDIWSSTYMICIIDSTIDFDRIHVTQPARANTSLFSQGAAGVLIQSGIVAINDSYLNCPVVTQANLALQNSTIQGNSMQTSSYPYYYFSNSNPCLTIGPAEGIQVRIMNSVITAEGNYGFVSFVANQVVDSTLELFDAEVIGGDFDFLPFTRGNPIKVASPGMLLSDCREFTIWINRIAVRGGNGGPAPNVPGNGLNAGSGGDGIQINRSSVYFCTIEPGWYAANNV